LNAIPNAGWHSLLLLKFFYQKKRHMHTGKKYLLVISCLFLSGIILSQPAKKTKPALLTIIDSALQKAVVQYKYLGAHLPENTFPKTYYPLTKKLETSNSGWWCSGFYPGSLLYLYEYSHDQALWNEAARMEKMQEKEQFNKGTHDLGFMMYCSFGNSNRLQPSKEYDEILMNSAKSLSTRFNATAGVIRSWDHGKWKYPVIIDNMMNLELLFWATKHSGDSSFYKIAVTHANTTMKNHYRPDNSSFHVVDYDVSTGNVLAKQTAQGYADYSAWARGQAWGLYGYVVMYRSTKDPKYLTQANKIANYIINHPNLPADKIPYWDYDSPDIPATYRDASAACITASALIELSRYTGTQKGEGYLNIAEQIIRNLSTRTYTAPVGDNGGFILKHSTGSLPGSSEVDVPLTYADYYYIEAMMRYKALKNR
jgi:unsaturated chondroitin disaccharide hydrolase